MVADPADNVSDLTARRARILGPIKLVRAYSKAKGRARPVLLVLASYADADTLLTRPGRATIEREAGVSRATARRAIRSLECPHYDPNKRPEGCGVTPCPDRELEVVEEGHGGRASVYRLILGPSPTGENPGDKRPSPTVDRGQGDPGEGSQGTRGRGQGDPPPGVTGIDREGVTFPDHCPTHSHVSNPPPCRRCGQTREANEAARSAAAKLERDEARRRRLEEDRRAIRSLPAPSPPPAEYRDARRRPKT